MGIVEDTLLEIATDTAEDVAGEHARRIMPSSVGRALILLVTLLAWILAVGLALTGLMWLASGAIGPGLGALAVGVLLAWVLTHPAKRATRG